MKSYPYLLMLQKKKKFMSQPLNEVLLLNVMVAFLFFDDI